MISTRIIRVLKGDVKNVVLLYNPRAMKFKYAFLVILIIVVIQVILMAFGLYNLFPEIDNTMHFSGGFAMGLLALAIHHDMTDKHDLRNHPTWYHYLFVIGFVVLIGVAWEFHEYLLDNTAVIWYHWPKFQLSLFDTMLDLLMDITGGTAAFVAFKNGL